MYILIISQYIWNIVIFCNSYISWNISICFQYCFNFLWVYFQAQILFLVYYISSLLFCTLCLLIVDILFVFTFLQYACCLSKYVQIVFIFLIWSRFFDCVFIVCFIIYFLVLYTVYLVFSIFYIYMIFSEKCIHFFIYNLVIMYFSCFKRI